MVSRVHILDSIMGSGKSSAAFRYMREHPDRRFLYITPYLSEVDRACETCDLSQADGESGTKYSELKQHMRLGKNVAATHALFYLLDESIFDIIKNEGYSLIVDESVEVVEQVPISSKDVQILLDRFVTVEDGGLLKWREEEIDYFGKFSQYKDLITTKDVIRRDTALVSVLNPDVLRVFNEVIFMTYLFDGQYLKAYLDNYGFEYDHIGVENKDNIYMFANKPMPPPAKDYRSLIHILSNKKLNELGDDEFAMSKSWFDRRSYNDSDVKKLRNNMYNYFRNICGSNSNNSIWTTYKDHRDLLIKGDGRFRNCFIPMNLRATNAYSECTNIAYMLNLFPNPNLTKFFDSQDDGDEICLDRDQYALSSMLQFLWRSAIRNDKPVNLYIPSARMRNLLIDWMNSNSGGVCA